MKKGFIAALMSAVLVFSLGMMAGCSTPQDQEQLIRTSLAEELDQLKNADEDIMEELVSSIETGVGASNLAQLESMGLSSQSIVESMLEGFDYTINDVTVNGNDAVAEVSVKAKNFSTFMTDLSEVITELTVSPTALAGMSQDEILTYVGEKVKEVLANLPLVDSMIDLDFEKEGNTWEPTAAATSALSSVFFQ